jgi:hypothetical protein
MKNEDSISHKGMHLSDVMAGIRILMEMEKDGHKLDDESREIVEIIATLISKRYSPHMFDEDEQRMIVEITQIKPS